MFLFILSFLFGGIRRKMSDLSRHSSSDLTESTVGTHFSKAVAFDPLDSSSSLLQTAVLVSG